MRCSFLCPHIPYYAKFPSLLYVNDNLIYGRRTSLTLYSLIHKVQLFTLKKKNPSFQIVQCVTLDDSYKTYQLSGQILSRLICISNILHLKNFIFFLLNSGLSLQLFESTTSLYKSNLVILASIAHHKCSQEGGCVLKLQ